MTDDPFKPLSAKNKKPALSISGREINSPSKARAGADRSLLAAIKNKTKYKDKKK